VYLQPALGTNDDYNRDTTYSYAQDEELYVCTSRSDLYIEPEYEFDVVSKLNYPRIGHSSTLMDDDKIIIIGGYDNQGNFIKEIETYDHKDKTTTLVGELSTARYKHSATKLIDGRILITGGYSEHGVLSSAEIYDPYTKTSKIINRMNYKRAEH
jgi:N-acetylneuraminic acid mutarotase